MKLSELAALEAEQRKGGYRALYLVQSGNHQGAGYEVHELTDDDGPFPTAAAAYEALDRLIRVAPDVLPGPVIDGPGWYVARPLRAKQEFGPKAVVINGPVPLTTPSGHVGGIVPSVPAEPIPASGPLKPPPGVLAAVQARYAALEDARAQAQTAARQDRLAPDEQDGESIHRPGGRTRVAAGSTDPDEVDYDEGVDGEVV